jgi:hypothetical protein
MGKPVFSAHIIWHSPSHSPTWELETEHPGFTSPIAAALFANNYTTPAPTLLQLNKGKILLTLTTNQVLHLPGDGRVLLSTEAPPTDATADPRTRSGLAGICVRLWRLTPPEDADDLIVATDTDYREIRGATPDAMSQSGLDGRWRPSSYDIRGPHGHVAVTVELDPSGEIVTAHVEQDEVLIEGAGQHSATITLIPRA